MLDDGHEDDVARMLRDSATAITRDGVARARGLRFQGPGYDPGVCRQMADLGWFGITVPEDLGGSGLGMSALGGLCFELGRVLAPEPLVETLLAARLLAAVDVEGAGRIMSGETRATVAWAAGTDGLDVAEGAGPFHGVAATAECDLVLIARRVGTATHLFSADPADIGITEAKLVDGCLAATVEDDGHGRDLGALPDGLIGTALDEATLATAFYLAGLGEGACAMTVDYLRERKQFDMPIGSFQALQHRAVDERIEIELATASCEEVARLLDAGATSADRARDVSRAKARASETALRVSRACVQLHGGIGYTDEYDIGLYLRKAMVVAHAYGSAGWHRRRYAASLRED